MFRVLLATVALCCFSPLLQGADYKVDELKEAPSGLAEPIAKLVNPAGWRITGKDGVVCDVWLLKEVSLKPMFKPTDRVKYPFMAGELIGVIRFPEKATGDFRGQSIAGGTYTLRYGQQPDDGNHLGTSEVRDFLLCCPTKVDVDPKRVTPIKSLFKLSAKAAGTTHPAVFQMQPPPEMPPAAPSAELHGEHKHLVVQLNLDGKSGDKQVKLRCAVANFDVKGGNMHANTLLLDTEVTTLLGSGSIDLGQEKLDLTLIQKTKNTSPLALPSPIYVRGNFAKPIVQVDRGRMAARALGAVALGVVNPLLALIPLIDAGPGQDSDCAQWLQGKK